MPLSIDSGTSVSGGLLYALCAIQTSDIESDRIAVDISGDGPNNQGSSVPGVRDQLVKQGVVINGLPIILDPTPVYGGSLADYYEDCVIGGPGSFIVTVTDVNQFQAAIRRKLILEIAGNQPEPSLVFVQGRLETRPKMDCVAAETIRPPRN